MHETPSLVLFWNPNRQEFRGCLLLVFSFCLIYHLAGAGELREMISHCLSHPWLCKSLGGDNVPPAESAVVWDICGHRGDLSCGHLSCHLWGYPVETKILREGDLKLQTSNFRMPAFQASWETKSDLCLQQLPSSFTEPVVTEVPHARDQSIRDLLILLQISTDFTLIIKSSIWVFILVLRMFLVLRGHSRWKSFGEPFKQYPGYSAFY